MTGGTGIPGISFIPSTGLTTQTFDGWPGGMNLALPGQEIDDTEARYIQDALLDKPGLTRRRGPVTSAGIGALTRKGTGLVSALNPQGSWRLAVLNGDAVNGYLSVYDSALATLVDLPWPHALPTSPGTGAPYRIVDAKPSLRGGSWVGVSSAYDAATPNQALARWFGGTKADATVTVTATRGSQSVTVSSTAALDTGMFLFSNTDDPYASAYLGVIKSIDTGTTLTLVSPSPYTATAKAGSATSIRGFAPKVAKGHLTTDTASTSVTGGATKFRSQKLDTGTILTGTLTNASAVVTGISSTATLSVGMPVTGTNVGANARILSIDSSTQVTLTAASTGAGAQSLTFKTPWDLYRASDGAWVGTVLSVQSETGLTLMANAGIAMADEAFVAIQANANFSTTTTGSTQKVGWITMNYADRQWYFNNGGDFAKTSRVWFSDASDPEIVDMSDFDGDWLDIVSTSNVNEPIRGAQAAYNGGVVFKENETFLITGSSPSSFGVRKLEDDGVLATGSIQAYASGVIWAGREGIHLYDGIQTQNLTAAKLGDYWKNTIRTFDPTKYRMWSMIARDHYFLFVESVSPTEPVIKGNTSTSLTKMTFVINLTTRAITTATNVDIRGSVTLPASAGKTAWYLVNDSSKGVVCDTELMFNTEGVDPITCDGSYAGPDFYVESKKFDGGDGLRLKRFKQLAVWYLAQGDAMNVDILLGLNEIGQTLSGNFPTSGFTWDTLRGQVTTWDSLKTQFATWNSIMQSVFVPKRVRFQKKNQYMAFRLYQASAAVTRMQVGPFQLGYKLQRPGRL